MLHTTALTAALAAAALSFSASAQRLETQGRFIVEAGTSKRFRAACANWYGLEEDGFAPGGLQFRSPAEIAGLISQYGFNCVRLPVSAQLVLNHTETWAPAVSAYPPLQGKTGLDALDAAVKALADAKLRIFLDLHTLSADWCCSPHDGQGLWYSANVSAAQWRDSLVALATRYRANPFVVGLDLKNELRDTIVSGKSLTVTWDSGNPATDWKPAAEEAAAAVLAAHPDLLIVVEGINYAGDLKGAIASPVVLPVANRLVYEAHNYGYWTNRREIPDYAAFRRHLDDSWGFLVVNETAPVWLGEFGNCNSPTDKCLRDTANSWQAQWWAYVRRYVQERSLDWGIWSMDGTQSHAPGRTFNKTEGYGVLDQTWSAPSNPVFLADLQAMMTD